MKAPVLAVLAGLLCALAPLDAGASDPVSKGPQALPLVAQVPAAQQGKWTRLALAGKPLWATLKTTKGEITVRLFSGEAPQTVANFVGLATGEREWIHPFLNIPSRRPLYEGTVFHRIVDGFILQGGDPSGTGRGGPGYRIPDELGAGRRFDRPGLLAMANRGPDSNGSQFFITVTPPDRLPGHLDGKHTIFGEVVKGYEVAVAISRVPVDGRGRPAREEVLLTRVELQDRAPRGLGTDAKRK